MTAAPFQTTTDAREFIASTTRKSEITVVSKRTKERRTFRFRKSSRSGRLSVDVLIGPENEYDYAYVGNWYTSPMKRACAFYHSERSRIESNAMPIIMLDWLSAVLDYDRPMPNTCEVWHSGTCSRCGRKLTDPESIATGRGPVCRQKNSLTLLW